MKPVFILLGCLFFLSCHRTLPQGLTKRSIAVPIFGNKTSEPVLAATFTAILKETLSQRSFQMAQNSDEGAFVLTGTIDQMTETPRSLNREGMGGAYRVTLAVTYRLSSHDSQTPIQWEDTADADWIARTGDLPGEQAERNRAIREICTKLSHRAVHRLTEIIAS